jgi:hypothetical protein
MMKGKLNLCEEYLNFRQRKKGVPLLGMGMEQKFNTSFMIR